MAMAGTHTRQSAWFLRLLCLWASAVLVFADERSLCMPSSPFSLISSFFLYLDLFEIGVIKKICFALTIQGYPTKKGFTN